LEDRPVLSTLAVTSYLDNGSAGTLRSVIAAASSGDTINFAPGLAGRTITLGSELAITKSLDIEGLGANQLTISGNNHSRVFDITGYVATVTLAGLTISDGLDESIGGFNGGGIKNVGTLTVNSCTLSGNVAHSSPFNSTDGGAIFNSGNLTINNSTISGNKAVGAPGQGATYTTSGPYASPASGGGIYMYTGTLSINSSTIAD